MQPDNQQPGIFLFSLDTELAWGYHHLASKWQTLFSQDGSRERRAILSILDMLDEYEISATWAVVGHLFYEKCEECEVCPILEWQGRYKSFEQIYKTDHPLWYGSDIVDTLIRRSGRHEIAFHGYTHRLFSPGGLSEEDARLEIREWKRVAERRGITPRTVIFPQNRIGHLDIFKEEGFVCYRGDSTGDDINPQGVFSKIAKHTHHILGTTTPPTYSYGDISIDPSGLVNVPASEHFFGFNRRLEEALDWLRLPNLRVKRMVNAVDEAADKGRIFHVWAHPWEFRSDTDIQKLRYLLDAVREKMQQGKLRTTTMLSLAQETLHLLVSALAVLIIGL